MTSSAVYDKCLFCNAAKKDLIWIKCGFICDNCVENKDIIPNSVVYSENKVRYCFDESELIFLLRGKVNPFTNSPLSSSFINQIIEKFPNLLSIEDCVLEDFHVEKQLGSGSFSKVFFALHKPTNKDVAMKVVEKKYTKDAINEIIVNTHLGYHSGIATFYDYFKYDDKYHLIFEYVSGKELYYSIRNGSIPFFEKVVILKKIGIALSYVHSKNIIYEDLKPENIVYNSSTKEVKLLDFGLSVIKKCCVYPTVFYGTIEYASPEKLKKEMYGKDADVWSFAILMYEMYTHDTPWRSDEIPIIKKRIINREVNVVNAAIPKDIQSLIKAIVDRAIVTIDDVLCILNIVS